ncbi:MAG: hypothetical protein FWG93_00940 [Oscillospiraceae bacterium]|nr:hypothetical protein [Oscillospiraceae bacterium]
MSGRRGKRQGERPARIRKRYAGIAVVLGAAALAVILLFPPGRTPAYTPETDAPASGSPPPAESAAPSPPPSEEPPAAASLTVEAGPDAVMPGAEDFLTDPARFPGAVLEGLPEPEALLTPGRYPLRVRAGGVWLETELIVADTTPPAGVPADVTVWQGDAAEAEAFVTDIEDVSPVTVRYRDPPPDTAVPGEHGVTVILEDAHGNAAEITASLTVREDRAPPRIEGARDLTFFLGDRAAYRRGVTALDRREGAEDLELDLEVNSSAVNLAEPGDYPLTYRAVDRAGNETVETVRVTVLEVTEERVGELAGALLEEITHPDMSIYQKAYAIYTWVTGRIYYAGSAEKDSVPLAAYLGFQTRQGDCYTFYALSEVLLTRIGAECLRVDRIDGYVNHYWNLVNLGDGWYHFDTTPFTIPCDTFLFTDAQAGEYTRIQRETVRNCYKFDPSLYPAVNTEPSSQFTGITP